MANNRIKGVLCPTCHMYMIATMNDDSKSVTLECCENTFDDLLANDELNDEELTCAIIQILMMLITYQNLFNLTHNDLHTNNIMYIKTDKQKEGLEQELDQ